jgi:malate synthase
VAPPRRPADRRVEITGPVDRKMIINALNSGANVFMADFEDSNAPTWSNMIDGRSTCATRCRHEIDFESPDRQALRSSPPTRRWWCARAAGTCDERTCVVDGEPMSGALFDFGLYFFHNAPTLLAAAAARTSTCRSWRATSRRGCGTTSSCRRGAPRPAAGTIKATVLIETLPAAFEMDEILYELREHIRGLNCGRWDYIFSFIKTLRAHPDRVLPDRGQVT